VLPELPGAGTLSINRPASRVESNSLQNQQVPEKHGLIASTENCLFNAISDAREKSGP
jgi:hypothetical protein